MTSEVDGIEIGTNIVPSESKEEFDSARGSPLNDNVSSTAEEESASAGTSSLGGKLNPRPRPSLKSLCSVEGSIGNFHSPNGGCRLTVTMCVCVDGWT